MIDLSSKSHDSSGSQTPTQQDSDSNVHGISTSGSDPPPYTLHAHDAPTRQRIGQGIGVAETVIQVVSPGNVPFINPWSAGIRPRSDTMDSTRISPSKSINMTESQLRYLEEMEGIRTYAHEGGGEITTSLSFDNDLSTKMRRRSLTLKKLVDSELFWLAMYFAFNLGLTLYNKIVLVSFPFPYTLTAMHALCGSIGCYILQESDYYRPIRLTSRQFFTLLAFSVLYAVNIAVSNLSLQLVTVPFHQVVRATSPLFTMILAYYMTNSTLSMLKLFSLLPVVFGVAFTTYGDYYFTTWGLVLTLFGTLLASLKTVVTNILQTTSRRPKLTNVALLSPHSTYKLTTQNVTPSLPKLHPLDLLGRMSPLAFIQCVTYGCLSGELQGVRRYGATKMSRLGLIGLFVNGVIAFGLNVVSFTANKKSGPLALSVAANVKQALTLVVAIYLFDLIITPTNFLGILLTLLGGAWYAVVEYQDKHRKGSLMRLTSLPKVHARE